VTNVIHVDIINNVKLKNHVISHFVSLEETIMDGSIWES